MDSNLAKPFRAQKVTNSNANEVITNFLIKEGTTILYGSDIRNMVKNEKSFNGKPIYNNPIIQYDEDTNQITFSKYEVDRQMRDMIYSPMVKSGYTFTCSPKQTNNAMKEIYIRTGHLISLLNKINPL